VNLSREDHRLARHLGMAETWEVGVVIDMILLTGKTGHLWGVRNFLEIC
jgi:hypothetical protein